MRSLGAAPASFLAEGGAPAFGSYAGPLPRVELGALGLRARIAQRKRWVWFGVSSDDVWIAGAVVRTGYAVTAFVFAYDLSLRKMLVDETTLGPAPCARIADDPQADGELARFAFGRSLARLTRDGSVLVVEAQIGRATLDLALDFASAPPAVSAIAKIGDGLVDATEKRALAAVRGRAILDGRSVSLDDALGGYDYTNGLLPRHTKWRWAFAMGRDAGGTPLAFNLCEGFVGEAECAAFVDGQVHPLAEPRFELDPRKPERPWRLGGEGIELGFEPGAVHAQNTRLVVVRSRFIQPVGTFAGALVAAGRTHRIAGLAGVVEDQDVLW